MLAQSKKKKKKSFSENSALQQLEWFGRQIERNAHPGLDRNRKLPYRGVWLLSKATPVDEFTEFRQELFCLHFVRTGDLFGSMRIAGYPPNPIRDGRTANNLLRGSRVQKRLKELMAIPPHELITVEEVINGLKREALLAEANGGKTGVRVKAWSLLGTYLGMFTKRIEIVPGSQLEVTEKIVKAENDTQDDNRHE